MTADVQAPPAPVRYRDVFAAREWRVLWFAQLASICGDQFARVALAVLVYRRTGSPLYAAAVFAVTGAALTVGGLFLSWVADRWPRRTVMVVLDVACAGLVLVMAVPGVPVPVLLVLLFAVGLAGEPFLAARMATNFEVLGPGRFEVGQSATLTTYQVGQLAGFAAGGVLVAGVGARGALLADAASFAVSAVLIRAGVRRRVPERQGGSPGVLAGLRVVFGSPLARTAMLLMWLAAFYGAPEGVTVPLARDLGGGPAAVGLLLAVPAAGAAAGPLLWIKLVPAGRRVALAAVMPAAACAVLLLFLIPAGLAGALVILAVSALFTGYVATTGDALMEVIPGGYQARAGGLIGAGMYAGQAVMVVLAGAAAGRVSPGLVLAGVGAAGTGAAVVLGVAWGRVRRAAV